MVHNILFLCTADVPDGCFTQKLPAAYVHAWHGMDNPQHNLLGVDWFGLVMGLGFVLSFGYWCTDFLVIQRAMAADSMASLQQGLIPR